MRPLSANSSVAKRTSHGTARANACSPVARRSHAPRPPPRTLGTAMAATKRSEPATSLRYPPMAPQAPGQRATVLVAFASVYESPPTCTRAGKETRVPPPATELIAPAAAAAAASTAPSARSMEESYTEPLRVSCPASPAPEAGHRGSGHVRRAHLRLLRGAQLPVVLLRTGDQPRGLLGPLHRPGLAGLPPDRLPPRPRRGGRPLPAAPRPLPRRRGPGRPRGQAEAPRRPGRLRHGPVAGAGRPRRDRVDPPLARDGDRRARRRGDGRRDPRPPVLRRRDGRPRAARQRHRPQLRDVQRRPHGGPRRGGAADVGPRRRRGSGDAGHRGLLPLRRALLPRGHLRPPPDPLPPPGAG